MLVHFLYGDARWDADPGAIFVAPVLDRSPPPGRMTTVWLSVARMTARYRSAPVPAFEDAARIASLLHPDLRITKPRIFPSTPQPRGY